MRITNSEECAKSELDLFSVPPTQTSIEESSWDIIYPTGNFDLSNTITFNIHGTNTHYINLSETEIYLKCKLVDTTNTIKDLTGNVAVSPINNVMHSIFSQIQVYLNNAPVENSNDTYAYRAYLENLLCYSKEAKENFLINEGWLEGDDLGVSGWTPIPRIANSNIYKAANPIRNMDRWNTPEVSYVDEATPGGKAYDANNPLPLISNFNRRQWFIREITNGTYETNTRQFCGKLHCDIFNINRYMLNNMDIRVVLTRNNPEFYLKGPDVTNNTRIQVTETFLKVRRASISPSIMLAHSMALEKTHAKYPIKRVIVRTLPIPFSSNKFTLQGLHNGIMPTRVVLGFVRSDAARGSIWHNPFYFEHMNISEMRLLVASKSIPYSTSLKFDFRKEHEITEGYNTLFKNIREAPNNISLTKYRDGYTLFAFDLTPDLCSAEHYSLLKDGSLDLDVTLRDQLIFSENIQTFGQSPAVTTNPDWTQQAAGNSWVSQFNQRDVAYTLVYYMEFDNIIEISKDRAVLYDYKI
jgi:hypothetical protein